MNYVNLNYHRRCRKNYIFNWMSESEWIISDFCLKNYVNSCWPKLLLPFCCPSLSISAASLTGKRQDPEDAKLYIRKLYEQQAINHDRRDERKTLYPHFTCATDTSNIRRVFSDVKDTVLLKSLRDYGVIWTFTPCSRLCLYWSLGVSGRQTVDPLDSF